MTISLIKQLNKITDKNKTKNKQNTFVLLIIKKKEKRKDKWYNQKCCMMGTDTLLKELGYQIYLCQRM